MYHLTSALARLGTPSAGAVCRAAEILRLRSRFVDGLLPLACGQSVHNYNMRTTWALVVCRAQSTGTADNKGAGSGPRSAAWLGHPQMPTPPSLIMPGGVGLGPDRAFPVMSK